MNNPGSYVYKAVTIDGKRVQGTVMAVSEADVYAKLRSDNLSPLQIRQANIPAQNSARRWLGWLPKSKGFSNLELEDFLRSLAVLLRAGADIRTALGVLSSDSDQVRAVSQKVLGGSRLDLALAEIIPAPLSHLRGLIAAGEARGDSAAGLDSAAHVLVTRRKIREQLVTALSYPAFVFLSAIIALTVILLVVVPAIAPLLEDTGHIPAYFKVIIAFSEGLAICWPFMIGALPILGGLVWFGWKFGGLKAWLDAWWLDGPFGAIAGPLVYGGYTKSLGDSLSAGASIGEALRLCQRGLGNGEAAKRLDVIANFVRQGRTLSESFRQVKAFPKAIIKLCEVGQASSTVGPMLSRAGEREETGALTKIDKYSKILGPILIVALGGLIGGLMAGVLGALSDIGSVAGT